MADSLVFTATDERHVDGRYFILWVKHTHQGADAFFFDDLSIEPLEWSAPTPSDPGPLPKPGDIVINEIQFDPLPGTSEFVELFNASDSTFDLKGLTFRDSRSSAIEIVDSTVYLEPGEFAVIAADRDAFAAQFRRTAFYDPSRWAALNNGGDSFVIEAGGLIVDSVAYIADAAPKGYSLERIDPAGPSEMSNFGPSVNPFGATPGGVNSIFAIDVEGPRLLFAEQVTAESVDLYFDEPLEEGTLDISSVRIGDVQPDSVTTGAGTVVTAHFSSLPRGTSVEVFGATDRRGNASQRLNSDIAFIPEPGELVITEVMYEPLADSYDGRPNQTEYVELSNRSDRMLALGRLSATRQVDEFGDADTLDVSLVQTALVPDAFYVIADDSTLAYQVSEVAVSVVPLSLPNQGDLFRLSNGDDVTLDSLTYGPELHHPDLLETRGVALERIDVHGPNNSSNWTSSVAESGGTPGRPNSVNARVPPNPGVNGVIVSPNPFSPDRDGVDDVATIRYELRSNIALVRIRIFDLQGVLIRELVPAELVNGHGSAYWNGLDDFGLPLRIGAYVLLLQAYDNRDHIAEAHKAVIVLARTL